MTKIFAVVIMVLSNLVPVFKKEDSKVGVKELKEAIKAVLAIALFLTKKFKDGVQFNDFTDFYTALTEDGEFKTIVQDGYEGYKQIPEEVKDIDAGEGIELSIVGVEYTEKFISEFQKAE